jgi:hypothetical protein
MDLDHTDFYSKITDWLKEQWQELTFEHILYLMAFSFILSYVTEYLLKFKQFRILYYTLAVLLLIKLFEGGHPIGGVETVYKLVLI